MPDPNQFPSFNSASQAMAHRFHLSIIGYDLGSWTKVSGLAVSWDLAEYRVGASDQYFKYAGQPKYDQLKLSRAVDATGTNQVKTWLDQVHATGGSSTGPLSGALEVLNTMGEVQVTWELKDVFPISWSITDFDASSGKVAIEQLSLVHNGYFGETGFRSYTGGTGTGQR